jgi:hypothetical protein
VPKRYAATTSRRSFLLIQVGCLLLAAWAGNVRVSAQAFVGTQSCGGSECHQKFELNWLTTQPGGKEHAGSIASIKSAKDKSDKYAKAVGLEDFLAPGEMCVKCHGTPVKGTIVGVGCERCHGAAERWRQPHADNSKDYGVAVRAGMRDLRQKPATWVKICRDCHVLDSAEQKGQYDTLLDSGHNAGTRWRVENKYTGVQSHWQKVKHTPEVIAAALKGVNPAGGAVVAENKQPTGTTEGTPPGGKPGGKPEGTPEGTPPETTPGGGKPPGGTPATTSVLPVPTGRGTSLGKGPGTTIVRVPVSPPPPPPPPDPVPTVTTPAITSPLGLTPPPPINAAGLLAALHDRTAGLLASLLRRNVVPAAPLRPPAFASHVTGPDAEFLRLQTEALALAIEALNLRVKPPAAATAPPTPPKP